MSDETRTPAKSWNDKIREARAQARELRQKEMNEALENDDVEEDDEKDYEDGGYCRRKRSSSIL